MRWFRRHPSRDELERWLEHGNAELDEHLDSCERCAERIETTARPAPPIADYLRTLLAPPNDLQLRIHAGVSQKLQTRDDLQLLAEMFGIPLGTLRSMGPPNEDT